MERRTKQGVALASLGMALAILAEGGWASKAWALRPMPSAQPSASASLAPGFEGLEGRRPDGTRVAFALQQTMVRADVLGHAARVEVRQRYQNPLNSPIDATYRFPLPDQAAVDEMEIHLGERVIRGLIKPKEEARSLYQEAQRTGRTAGLLEQARANLFIQQLANLRPGEKIEVVIRYTQALPYEGGDHEFFFPMAAAPRYDAPGLNPPVLMPGQSSPHRMDLQVRLSPGFRVGSVLSPTHRIQVQNAGMNATIRLDPSDLQANRDFRLRYRVAGPRTEAHVVAAKGPQGGHFLAYLTPALKVAPSEQLARDLVFLMDTSGSQGGFPMQASKRMMEHFIEGLGPKDTFNVVDFASTTDALSRTPLPNTQANRERALAYVHSLSADGGTELRAGIEYVLGLPAAPQGRLRTIVMLTDGLIGDDDNVIASLKRGLKAGQRLLVLGTGSSVNTSILNRMAAVGRGAVAYVTEASQADVVARSFAQKLGRPVLRDISLSWEGVPGTRPDFLPAQPRDLYAAEPLVVAGRVPTGSDGVLWVRGIQADGRRFQQRLPVRFGESANKAPAQLWARAKLQSVEDELSGRPYDGEAAKRIRDLAMDYGLLSRETAFIAMTEEVRVKPNGQRIRVEVPAEAPPGMFQANENSAHEGLGRAYSGAPPGQSPGSVYPALRPPAPHATYRQDTREPAPQPRMLALKSSSTGLERRARQALYQHMQSVVNQAPIGPWSVQIRVEAHRLTDGKVVLRGLRRVKATGADQAFLKALEERLLAWNPPAWVQGELILDFGDRN